MRCKSCGGEIDESVGYEKCPACDEINYREEMAKSAELSLPLETNDGDIFSCYPMLRTLSGVYKFLGMLCFISAGVCLLIFFGRGAYSLGGAIGLYLVSGVILLALPEGILIIVRIERSLASIDGKLKDK